jgi:beta-glucosidase/6-phospho-beta-glucosidase/beta-galactosidase
MEIKFKDHFSLGVAALATQIEGGDCGHNWNDWYEKGKIKVGSNPARATDHYHYWKEDADLMAAMKIKHYRMGIEWARICPKEDEVNEVAIEHYRNEIKYLQGQGISKYANEINADLFVSIHGNTFDDSSVTGTETFYYHNFSKSFAEIIHNHLIQATGFKDRGVKKEEFFVLTDTDMPAVLLEIGYLTNPQDESEMLTEAFQTRVAQAIVDGIKEYQLKS